MPQRLLGQPRTRRTRLRADSPSSPASHARRALIESTLASFAVAGIVAISLVGLWRTSEQAHVDEMRQGLMRLAGIAASTIDPDLHRRIQDPSQIDTPLYDQAIAGLRRARAATRGVKYMYTIVRDGSKLRFVLDAAVPGDHDGDGREDRAQVWEPYETPDSELVVALGAPGRPGTPTASLVPHVDAWGSFMTGYAPIVDGAGEQIGVVGVDVPAEEYHAQLARVRRQVAMGVIPGVALTVSVGLGVFLLRRRQLASLRMAEEGERRAIEAARRLAESERRFRTLADSAPMLVWSADASGHCDFVNKPWCDFTGRPRELDLGEGWLECIHPEDREHTRERYWSALRERGTFLAEYRLRRSDGAYRLILDKGVPFEDDGRFAGFIGAGLDITELRRAESELKRAYRAAQSADRAKSEFLANMSHEIRTPLTTILGYAEILRLDGDPERAPPSRIQAIDAIHSAGEHLLAITNDILDLSKIEAGAMKVERVETDLAAVLRNSIELLRFKAREKGLGLDAVFDSPVPARVISDPTRLRQIILNLLANAVKFTREGSVTLRCAVDGETLIIDVEDTGIGMHPDQAQDLFRPFTQADATVSRTHGGTGLGLAICRRLAALMGGSVALAWTIPNVGSRFTLRISAPAAPGAALITSLPSIGAPGWLEAARSLAPVTAQGAGRAPARPATTRLSGRILLVEDGGDNRRLIAHHLERAGASISTAENGRAALEIVAASSDACRPFDLIVTDMQMPEMDGLTLVRALRSRGVVTPIVALTAHAMTDERDKCLEAGCNDFASKPIDRASLLAVCGQWMHGDRTRAVPRSHAA